MFRLIKQVFIELLNFGGSVATKCVVKLLILYD